MTFATIRNSFITHRPDRLTLVGGYFKKANPQQKMSKKSVLLKAVQYAILLKDKYYV